MKTANTATRVPANKTSLDRRFRTLLSASRTPVVYQAQVTECGVAALGIILGYFGRWVAMDELREKTGVSRDGTNAADLIRAAREYGVIGKAFRGEPETLSRRRLPLIAHLSFIHFVVVEKVVGKHVYVNDPGVGRYRMRAEEFAERFTGVGIEFEADAGFERGGRRWRLRDWIFARLRGLRLELLSCAALGAAMALAGTVFAILFGTVFEGAGGDSPGKPGWLLAALATAALLRLVLGCGLEASLMRVERRLRSRTPEFLRHLVSLPWSFFSYRLPDDLHSIVLANEEQAGILARQCLRALAAGVGIPILVAALLAVHPGLGGGAICLAGLFGLLSAILLRRSTGYSNLPDSLVDRWGASWANTIRGIEMQRTGGRDQEFFSQSAANFAGMIGSRQRSERARGGTESAYRAAQLLLVAAIAAGAHRIPLAALIALQLLGIQLLSALRQVVFARTFLDELGQNARQADQVARMGPVPTTVETGADMASARGAIAVTGLTFGFSRFRPALLKEVSFAVEAGSQTGISGSTGSGKSTLAAVLTGLHRPWSGSVELDGIPLDSIPPKRLTNLIGCVHKTPLLFEATLRDNISLWDPAVTEGDITRAVEDACLDDVLGARSGGLEMRVSSQGANFSGGQRQRIEIARALARNVRVLILDEANDALESDLEESIRTNLRRRGCTLIVISHRETTLRACDRVLYLADGRIRDSQAGAQTTPASAASASGPSREPVRDAPCGAELAAAFRVVARASSIRLGEAMPALPAQGEAGVMELARRCGIRARRVRLIRRRWWRHRDYGPMLAFLDGAPVALLPGWTGYRVVKGETKAPLREADAARLGKYMYVLHAPDRSSRTAMDLIRASARARKREPIYAALWACAGAAAASMLPVLAYRAIGGGVSGAGQIPAALASCAAAVLLGLACNACFVRLTAHLQIDISSSLFDRLLRLPADYFRRNSAGILGRRLAGASLALDSGVGGQLAGLFALPYCLAGLLLTAALTPGAAMFAVAAVAILALVPAVGMRQELKLEPERARLHAAHRQFLADALHGFARLRVLSSETRIVEQWQRFWSAERRLALRQHRARILPAALESAWPAALVFFAIGVAHSSCSLPRLVGGALAFTQCALGAAMVGAGLRAALKVRSLLRPIDGFLAEPGEPAMPALSPRPASGAVEIRHAAFHYEDARGCALEEISLAIRPGEMLAITGPSGSGKSTLLRIIAGLERPSKGEVLYDGSRLEEWGANALRAQFGVVLQEDSLAVSTARYNIAGQGEFRLEEAWEAARLAVVDGDIERMPMGMQTILDDEHISTGQKQRILLASRLLRRPRLLLLDEAASALDAEIQWRVLANIRALGIACVSVTHRASTIALADRVAMLERGRLVWTGPVEEWLARHPAPEMPPCDHGVLREDQAARPANVELRPAKRIIFLAHALSEFDGPRNSGAPAYLLPPGYGLAAAGIGFLSFAVFRAVLFLF